MKLTSECRKKPGITEQILKAMKSIETYQYRSAPGLAEQTNIPLEHVEFYLIKMAQSALVIVGKDRDNVLWVHLGKE